MFENWVLRRMFGPIRDEVAGEWRKLHNQELNDLHCSPNVIRVIESRRVRWAKHVARVREKKGPYRFWWENLREQDHLEHPGVGGRIIRVLS
jgi:hypothetical protein